MPRIAKRDRALFEAAYNLRKNYNSRGDLDRLLEWPGTDAPIFSVEKAQRFLTSQFVRVIHPENFLYE